MINSTMQAFLDNEFGLARNKWTTKALGPLMEKIGFPTTYSQTVLVLCILDDFSFFDATYVALLFGLHQPHEIVTIPFEDIAYGE